MHVARDFLAEYRRPIPALMKLDTQGTELEILSSLLDAQLEELLCVETEVEFLELYQGQPTFGDVDGFMREQGFRLLDLRTHRSYRNANDESLPLPSQVPAHRNRERGAERRAGRG